MNKVIFTGNLTTEPIDQSNENLVIVLLRMAVVSSLKTTDYHFIKCFGPTGEFARKHLHKGDYLYVEGKIKNHKVTSTTNPDKIFDRVEIYADHIEIDLKGFRTPSDNLEK